MGYLLKEALKTLCGVNQWSYAVFWKIGCQNPKLLIWEECYYGPITYSNLPHISGIENPDVVFDEWEACWVYSEARNSLLGVQAGERVQLLVNKMMMDNHVNVVGEGLVGRAAFTGNYQWILSQNYTRESHPPEVLNELHQQVSAGMQTIAVIPVLPHGVLQLGSSSAIMENMGFVNDVKTLVLQLGCVPGALFSDSYATKEPAPKIGASIGLRKSASIDSSGKSKVTDLSHLTSYINDNYNQQDNSRASRGVGQTSNFLIRQIQDNLESTGPTFQSPRSSFKTNSHGHAEVNPVMKPKNQLENGLAGAEIIPSNPEAWLNQETSFLVPVSRMNQQPSAGQLARNYGSLRYLEEQLLVDAVGGDHVNNRLNESNIYSSHWRTNGGLVTSSYKGSSSVILHDPSDLHNGLGGHLSATSNPSSVPTAHRLANTNISSACAGGLQNVAQYKTEVSNSGFAENLTTSQLLSDSSDHKNQLMDKKCTQVDVDEGKAEMKDEIFPAISIPFPQSDEHTSLTGHIPGYGHCDGQKHDYGCRSMELNNAQFEDAYVQAQSGDDLFDILGVNFKNKLLYESFLNNGLGTNPQNVDKSNHASNKLQNVCSGLQLVNEGKSDSGIFSVTGTDHLLDAVVSKVQSAMKQSSDDNASCRTTLTKLSSSSAPLASPSTGQANASNQMQEELLGVSKSLTKAGVLGSCSFKSGSFKEDVGSYSQTNSFFGSQISSWVEQGHDMKCSTSASTAYSKKTDEISKSNRKRLKPGENPRPRPKDRQMIQDRVKELREIVPNGAKCSIDALLERTIKHMLFLQSVTKHADKLKQTGESKVRKIAWRSMVGLQDPLMIIADIMTLQDRGKEIISEEGGLLLKDNFEGGATWAYEVGSQSMVCPIIVEDLNRPRQMLVEMLCEERGLFLEIADIIRGLGLTILKGVMETQNDKIWARFAVEANRDVTRMEIFISLVRLLEQTVKSSSAPVNCIGNDNASACQSFHQAASIPATGMPCGFQ